jgi:aryl-alcohol dehydrogenase-like predicted oxidoreductase
VVCVQNSFSLDSEPSAHDVLRECERRGVAFVPFFAIAGSGREAGATGDHAEAVLEIARAHGATPQQIRLAWTLDVGSNVLAIPGTGNLAHLEDNIAAGALRLSSGEMKALAPVR